jgi:hypothetical protein
MHYSSSPTSKQVDEAVPAAVVAPVDDAKKATTLLNSAEIVINNQPLVVARNHWQIVIPTLLLGFF